MAGEDTTGRLARLADRAGRQADQATRRVGEVETLLHQLAADVASLARLLAPPPGDDAEGTPAGAVRSWLGAQDPAGARADLTDLARWLAAVYLRYGGAALPSCWAWHPAVVEELWWLRNAHRAAYEGEDASWARVADWHDRARPGVVARVREAAGECDLSRHVTGGAALRGAPVVALAGATDRIAEHWTTTRQTPEPTPEQLTEATEHDQNQRRTSHR